MQLRLFAQILPGVATAFGTLVVGAIATTTSNQPSYAGNNKFFCTQENGVPVTKVNTSRGPETFIRWVVADFKKFPASQRCKIVSARFQRYYDNGSLFITSRDNFNGYPVLCIANRKGIPCTSENIAKSSYTVQTSDGKQHTFNQSQVKKFTPGLDLVTFEFKSNQNYSVAEKGNSDQVTGGETIYVAGYPDGIPNIPGRIFQCLQTSISGRVEKPKSNGYTLVYPVNGFPGMSGGPILDEQGKLVGISGELTTRPDTNATVTLGIPLKTYLSLASTAAPI